MSEKKIGLGKLLQLFWEVTLGLPKTLLFNFRYFPLRTAICFPVLVAPNVFFRNLKGRVKIEGTVKTRSILLGFRPDRSLLDKKLRTVWSVSGEVIFQGGALFGDGNEITVGPDAQLIFGDNFKLTSRTNILCFKKISFGDNCLVGWETRVMDTDFHSLYDNDNNLLNPDTPIIVGNNVWIAARCMILKGTTLPDGSIVGANTVVSKCFTSKNSVICGNPGKVIKKEVKWA